MTLTKYDIAMLRGVDTEVDREFGVLIRLNAILDGKP